MKAFDLIHMDIWGPLTHYLWMVSHTIFTIVDDCTIFGWTFPMNIKYDTRSIIKKNLQFCVIIIFYKNKKH